MAFLHTEALARERVSIASLAATFGCNLGDLLEDLLPSAADVVQAAVLHVPAREDAAMLRVENVVWRVLQASRLVLATTEVLLLLLRELRLGQRRVLVAPEYLALRLVAHLQLILLCHQPLLLLLVVDGDKVRSLAVAEHGR